MRIRSGFSFHTAFGKVEDVIDRCKSVGFSTVPLTDRTSTFGFRKFRDVCVKKGIKPAYGVEIGIVERSAEKKPVINYWTFLAKENIRAVNTIVKNATESVAKEPSQIIGMATANPGVVRIVGERAKFDHIMQLEGVKDTYIALSPSTPKKLAAAAIIRNIPLIAVSDNYYPNPDDLEVYRMALGRRASTQTYPMHILSRSEEHTSELQSH